MTISTDPSIQRLTIKYGVELERPSNDGSLPFDSPNAGVFAG